MKSTLITLLFSILFGFSQTAWCEQSRNIYLLRHAEKIQGGTRDPSLTEVGRSRASNLVEQLKNQSIVAIYSSDYLRTKETAAPLAKHLGLTIQLYDPRKLKAFAKQILSTKGNIVIVGHSNTTPQLVILLGGDAHGDIDESEYDRLYRLTVSKNKTLTKLLRSRPIQ